MVDATILRAPTSTKNREQQRDAEVHQTKKGNQWYFGMKAHVGVDSKTKIIHTAVATSAHVADSTVLPDLQHGKLRYRGRKQSAHQLFVICALVNLFLGRKKLMLATSA